jgi:hypothetical protein
LDKIDATMKAGQEKMEVRTETGQEQMEARIKTDLEDMRVTELEANQEKTGAVVEYCNWTLCVKTKHVLTTLQDRASDVVHQPPKGQTFEKR